MHSAPALMATTKSECVYEFISYLDELSKPRIAFESIYCQISLSRYRSLVYRPYFARTEVRLITQEIPMCWSPSSWNLEETSKTHIRIFTRSWGKFEIRSGTCSLQEHYVSRQSSAIIIKQQQQAAKQKDKAPVAMLQGPFLVKTQERALAQPLF